ncbi:MAG: hypothetical protein MZV65_19730 [Chromatiales bacterium]|nr:hypothetical protein [Chromatiales bacterium]
MGRLHDAAEGHAATPAIRWKFYLVRLLFCLFAEDTGIFEPAARFSDLDRGAHRRGRHRSRPTISAQLFQVLNTPRRQAPAQISTSSCAAFPYVNGKLFEEMLPLGGFDSRRCEQALLDCLRAGLERHFSPAIFGALFQSIMDEKARRNLGAHYTSEENILKLIKPLFLDALREEFDKDQATTATGCSSSTRSCAA